MARFGGEHLLGNHFNKQRRRFPMREPRKVAREKPQKFISDNHEVSCTFGGHYTDREAEESAEQKRIQELIGKIAAIFNGNRFKSEISLSEKRAAAEAFSELLPPNLNHCDDISVWLFNSITNREPRLLTLYKRLLFEHSHQE